MSNKRKRVGIIPYSFDDEGKDVVLLGKERGAKWSPFAGGLEANETLQEGAVREFVEEINGFFSRSEIMPLVSDDNKIVINYSYSISYYYIIDLYYDPVLPGYFKNVSDYFTSLANGRKDQWGTPILCDTCEGALEKEEIKWFRLEDFVQMSTDQVFNTFNRDTTKLLNKLTRK